MLTIQYLEASPTLARLDRNQVVAKLRAAAERLPITHLIIGWQLPLPLLQACQMEAARLGMELLRWQPLLAFDPALHPEPEWGVVGMSGKRLIGYRGLPEFTFLCPNHPSVQEAVFRHLEQLVRSGVYQGFFLDRVRYPSPATNPIDNLACFCVHCQRKAAECGLDLEQLRSHMLHSLQDNSAHLALVSALLSRKTDQEHPELEQSLNPFLAFREASISDFLAKITRLLRDAHLEIGLDCYSPLLTYMVGQNLRSLSAHVDWVKLMTYAHTMAPAGLPFELSGLVRYLASAIHITRAKALELVGEVSGLPMPARLSLLEKEGLSSWALNKDINDGVSSSLHPVLAGIELVKIRGVTGITPDQIRSDLAALKGTGIAGLSLSWDLLHIPLEWLDLVKQVYFAPGGV